MTDILFEIGISNSIISLVLALVALTVGKFFDKPFLVHLLWLLVLVKLLMPSFLAIPIPVKNATGPVDSPSAVSVIETAQISASAPFNGRVPPAAPSAYSGIAAALYETARPLLPLIWGLGILTALSWSLFRVFRFDRLLRIGSTEAPETVSETARELSESLGIVKLPSIYETSAEITPMVWWLGRRVRIYIPSILIKNLEPGQLRLVLAHELAHVRRRDYLVRWIEWTAAVLFWWNPVVWWAQRNLRAYEEICCDSLILSTFEPKPHQYASSLLSAVEQFAGSAVRPPSMASEVNSGGYLIRRIHMILSENRDSAFSRSLSILVFSLAIIILPLAFVNGQDSADTRELEKTEQRLKAAVEAGTMSKKEAIVEMALLKSEFEYREAEKKIGRAVAEGKITPEDAAKKLAAFKERGIERAKRAVEVKLAAEELERSVGEGRISKEEVKAKMRELEMRLESEQRNSQFQKATRELVEAMSLNKISVEEAQAKIAALQLGESDSAKAFAFGSAAAKLRHLMESGKIPKAEAEKRMLEFELKYPEQKIAGNLARTASKLKAMVDSNKISASEAAASLRKMKADLATAKSAAEKLMRALEANKISRAEAQLKYEALRLNYDRVKQDAALKRAAAELKAAEKAGRISADEAKAKLSEMEKQLDEPKL